MSPEIEEHIKTECRFDVLKFPSNVKGKLQPMDLSVNRPFKANCLQKREDFMASLDVNDKKDLTPSGYLKFASRETRLFWMFWY